MGEISFDPEYTGRYIRFLAEMQGAFVPVGGKTMNEKMEQDVFDELMGGFNAIKHDFHEPCRGCLQSDKEYEKLAERFSVSQQTLQASQRERNLLRQFLRSAFWTDAEIDARLSEYINEDKRENERLTNALKRLDETDVLVHYLGDEPEQVAAKREALAALKEAE